MDFLEEAASCFEDTGLVIVLILTVAIQMHPMI